MLIQLFISPTYSQTHGHFTSKEPRPIAGFPLGSGMVDQTCKGGKCGIRHPALCHWHWRTCQGEAPTTLCSQWDFQQVAQGALSWSLAINTHSFLAEVSTLEGRWASIHGTNTYRASATCQELLKCWGCSRKEQTKFLPFWNLQNSKFI